MNSGYGRYLAFPFRIGKDGRSERVAGLDEHVRDEIIQLILTATGERLYLGAFGTGVRRLTFENIDDAVVGVTKASIANALGEWLGHRVRVEALEVTFDEATLSVNLRYQVNGGSQNTLSFQRQVG